MAATSFVVLALAAGEGFAAANMVFSPAGAIEQPSLERILFEDGGARGNRIRCRLTLNGSLREELLVPAANVTVGQITEVRIGIGECEVGFVFSVLALPWTIKAEIEEVGGFRNAGARPEALNRIIYTLTTGGTGTPGFRLAGFGECLYGGDLKLEAPVRHEGTQVRLMRTFWKYRIGLLTLDSTIEYRFVSGAESCPRSIRITGQFQPPTTVQSLFVG